MSDRKLRRLDVEGVKREEPPKIGSVRLEWFPNADCPVTIVSERRVTSTQMDYIYEYLKRHEKRYCIFCGGSNSITCSCNGEPVYSVDDWDDED